MGSSFFWIFGSLGCWGSCGSLVLLLLLKVVVCVFVVCTSCNRNSPLHAFVVCFYMDPTKGPMTTDKQRTQRTWGPRTGRPKDPKNQGPAKTSTTLLQFLRRSIRTHIIAWRKAQHIESGVRRLEASVRGGGPDRLICIKQGHWWITPLGLCQVPMTFSRSLSRHTGQSAFDNISTLACGRVIWSRDVFHLCVAAPTAVRHCL